MSEHTPGPWRVNEYARNLVKTENYGIADVAMCSPWVDKPPMKEQEANARLIAAAPDLLEACKAAEQSYTWEAFLGVIPQLQAAIAKATGDDS